MNNKQTHYTEAQMELNRFVRFFVTDAMNDCLDQFGYDHYRNAHKCSKKDMMECLENIVWGPRIHRFNGYEQDYIRAGAIADLEREMDRLDFLR